MFVEIPATGKKLGCACAKVLRTPFALIDLLTPLWHRDVAEFSYRYCGEEEQGFAVSLIDRR